MQLRGPEVCSDLPFALDKVMPEAILSDEDGRRQHDADVKVLHLKSCRQNIVSDLIRKTWDLLKDAETAGTASNRRLRLHIECSPILLD